jgi:hypothetical protein
MASNYNTRGRLAFADKVGRGAVNQHFGGSPADMMRTEKLLPR